jgi:hypothetical protein
MTESEPKYDGQLTYESKDKLWAELEAIRARQRAVRAAMVRRLAENKLLPFQSFNMMDDER